MTDRLDPRDLFRGHRKVLTLRTNKTSRADRIARVAVYLVPVAAGGAVWYFGVPLRSAEGLLAGLALVSAGLLATFAQLAAWRDRLSQRAHLFEDAEASDRESLDEAVTHVLVASLWSVVGVAVMVIGQSLSTEKDYALVGWTAGLAVAVLLHVSLLFVMVIFRLYDAYLYLNEVPDRINGSVRD